MSPTTSDSILRQQSYRASDFNIKAKCEIFNELDYFATTHSSERRSLFKAGRFNTAAPRKTSPHSYEETMTGRDSVAESSVVEGLIVCKVQRLS